MCRGGGWNEERERERGMKRDGAACTWVSGVKRAAHRRGTTPRLVRGRRDRCPWDARAFLVREAHETNGRRASPDHAFPREKKLRCVYPWLAFRLSRPSTSPSPLSSSSSPRSPIHQGERGREGGRESYTSGVVSQFLPYMPPPMRINFFLAEKRSGNRAPLLFLLRTKLREAREARQRSTSFP